MRFFKGRAIPEVMRSILAVLCMSLFAVAAGAQEEAPDDIVDFEEAPSPAAESATPPAEKKAPVDPESASGDETRAKETPPHDNDSPAEKADPDPRERTAGDAGEESATEPSTDDGAPGQEGSSEPAAEAAAGAEDEGGVGLTPWLITGTAVGATLGSMAAFVATGVLLGVALYVRQSNAQIGDYIALASVIPNVIALSLIGPMGALVMTLLATAYSAALDDDFGRTGWTAGLGLVGCGESFCGTGCFGLGALFAALGGVLLYAGIPVAAVPAFCGVCMASWAAGLCVTSTLTSGVSSAIANGLSAPEAGEVPLDDGEYEDGEYEDREYEDREYEDREYEDREYEDREYEDRAAGDPPPGAARDDDAGDAPEALGNAPEARRQMRF